ncbi:MAG: hypothetical protein MUD03_12785 [Pirellula sp.]|nr:hypothetical protein [Pirellula sp.]
MENGYYIGTPFGKRLIQADTVWGTVDTEGAGSCLLAFFGLVFLGFLHGAARCFGLTLIATSITLSMLRLEGNPVPENDRHSRMELADQAAFGMNYGH